MWLNISQIFQCLSHDPNVRAIVLTSAGDRAFTAGLDIKVNPQPLFSYYHPLTYWSPGGLLRRPHRPHRRRPRPHRQRAAPAHPRVPSLYQRRRGLREARHRSPARHRVRACPRPLARLRHPRRRRLHQLLRQGGRHRARGRHRHAVAAAARGWQRQLGEGCVFVGTRVRC